VEIQPRQPSVKAPAERFTGDAWYDVIAQGKEPSRNGGCQYAKCSSLGLQLCNGNRRYLSVHYRVRGRTAWPRDKPATLSPVA
jgi:hypothetical protein